MMYSKKSNALTVITLLAAALVFASTSAGQESEEIPSPGSSQQLGRARGETFSIPVPKGFTTSSDERFTSMAPGGIVLVAKERSEPGMFISSIVVIRVPRGSDFIPSDPVFCRAEGEATASFLAAELESYEIVETAIGNMCQFYLKDGSRDNRAALMTLMYESGSNTWAVTCNFDVSDTRAKEACTEVLSDWEFH